MRPFDPEVPWGQVLSGELTLKAASRKRQDLSLSNRTLLELRKMPDCKEEIHDDCVFIRIGTADLSTEDTHLYNFRTEVVGLILKPVENRKYRRIGMFSTENFMFHWYGNNHDEDLLESKYKILAKWQLEDITII